MGTGKSKFSCRAILVRPLSLKPPQNWANLLLFTVELPTFLNFQKQTDTRLSLIKILNPPVPTPKTGETTKDKIGHIFRKTKTFSKSKISLIKVGLLVQYFSKKKKSERSDGFLLLKLTLKIGILQSLRRSLIILVGLTMT